MNLLLITTCDNPNHEGWIRLKNTLDKHGWKYELIIHKFEFGRQLNVVKDWLNKYQGEATHIIYVDAYDNICFGSPDEVIDKFKEFKTDFLISAEKACYPHPERAIDYPEHESPWKYVNGGGWIGEIIYIREYLNQHLLPDSHDQVFLMEWFLDSYSQLDYQCQIFQTIAFSNPNEWEKVEDRWVNILLKSKPIFFHSNGRTEDKWLCGN